ncbi:MAG: hypothetical protein AB8F95_06710 [Bacteroidia bacterium]
MQRIVIEANNPSGVEHLLALLKRMDFVRDAWLEEVEASTETLNGLQEAVEEVKLTKAGKLKLQSAQSLLDKL